MSDINEFQSQLSGALSAKSEQLERTDIPKLRKHLQEFEAGVSTMYKFLIEKGFLQKDPYKNEHAVTKIHVPSSEPFTDAEAISEISLRFSAYVSQWEFIVNIFDASLSNLSLKKVKRLLELIEWIRWTDFSPNSPFQITRAVADTVGKITKMNDPIAGKMISSSITFLRNNSNNIKGDLKAITVFLRERYKYSLREEVLNRNVHQPGTVPPESSKHPG